MTERARRTVLTAGLLGLLALLGWALADLPPFGTSPPTLGGLLAGRSLEDTHATNAVASIVFDYRAADTLGEEFILFAAVAGIALLLRAQRDEVEATSEDAAPGRDVPPTSDAVHLAGVVFSGGAVLLGGYTIVHGHLTPGGGFQGGVVLAGALLMLYVADDYDTFQRITSMRLLEREEAVGAGLFALVGLAGIVGGTGFLANFLPLGTPGRLVSAGTVPLLNLAVGLAVAAGSVLIVDEFLEQALRIRQRS